MMQSPSFGPHVQDSGVSANGVGENENKHINEYHHMQKARHHQPKELTSAVQLAVFRVGV